MQSQCPAANALRSAVSAGEFQKAEQLLAEYRQTVVDSWNAASLAERQALAAEVTELLEWARVATLSTRAHAQCKLVLLSRQRSYAGDATTRQRMSVDA